MKSGSDPEAAFPGNSLENGFLIKGGFAKCRHSNLKKLTKFFGAVPAVLEASLTVEEGDFFGFVGPNGSGKSTTIRMMMNYVRPTSGTATILGMDSRSQSGKLKKMVGYVPSEVDYYMDMRAMEVIRYAARYEGASG